MLDVLDIRAGQAVLDLGCGPGTDLGVLAEAVTAAGVVVGVDRDQAMIEAARERSADQPLADRAVDRARTDRVLQHVVDPPGTR
jgi:ubiquinone/menaquinone biosynthesis C-methylase UbiE